MGMKLAFGIALLALATFAFADVGPPPAGLPSVIVYAAIDGAQVPDGTISEMHCFVGSEEIEMPGWRGYCREGVCEGGSVYKLNPCARDGGNATFEFSNPAWDRNYTTNPPVLIAKGNDYEFNVSISSSAGTAGISGEGTPQLFNPCAIAFALCGAAVVALFAVKK